jgi:hypothetical protein
VLAGTEYPHRRNSDGTWDPIGKHCFLTVANCKTESKLVEFEKFHVCNSALLAERGLRTESGDFTWKDVPNLTLHSPTASTAA